MGEEFPGVRRPIVSGPARVVFAVAAHPDDIEFMMAGTLFLLREAGYELHYMNIANGSCGTVTRSRDEIVAIRTEEARARPPRWWGRIITLL